MQDLIERKYTKHRKNPTALEKGPRHHAAEILALPKEQQADALNRVPPHLFTWVAEYVNDPHAEQRIVNSVAASIAKLGRRQDRFDALAKVPEMFREKVKTAAIAMMEREAIQHEGAA